MLAYIIRRTLYVFPILLGVNALTFALFFMVNTPDDMARMQLGERYITEQAITTWKQERGYDRELLWNDSAEGLKKSRTLFFLINPYRYLALNLVKQMMDVISVRILKPECGLA